MTLGPLFPDRLILALLVFGEARGEPVEGQIAVAQVVRNRVHARSVPLPWRDVCLAPQQFSCFNADSPEAAVMQCAATFLVRGPLTPPLTQALWIADGVMGGLVKDNTGGATHYLTRELYHATPPTWAQGQPVLTTIGQHVFLAVA